jgi:inner membrane transporter RhtA
MESCNSLWFVHEFDFLSHIGIPLDWQVTQVIGHYWSLFLGSKRFVDYLWVLLAAAGCFDPWTNNGINVWVLFALLAGAFLGFYIVLGGRFKMKDRRLLQLGAVCF